MGRKPTFSPFIRAYRIRKEGEFSFSVTQLRPHPNPPKGRGSLPTAAWHTGIEFGSGFYFINSI